jgi:branched-chain amino acid transport system substrate-binding protein
LSGTFATPQYLDIINAMTKVPGNDKIDGRPSQIIAKDDQGNATTGSAAARELLDSDKVDVIIGTNFTAVANAELPLTTAAKKLQLSLSGCAACGDGATYPYNLSDEFDRPTQGPAAAQAGGVTVSKDVTFQPGTLDYGNQINELKDSGAKLVYIASIAPADEVNIVKAFDEADYHPILTGNSSIDTGTVAAATSNKDWVATWQTSGFGIGELNQTLSPQVKTWRDQMKTALGDKYTAVAAAGLNSVAAGGDWYNVFKLAVEATHSTDGPTLAKWIEGQTFPNALRAAYTFTSTRHNGFTSDQVGWAQPGTIKDGFADAAQGTQP